MYSESLWSGLKILYYIDHFYEGDTSLLSEDRYKKILFLMPVYKYMFNMRNDFIDEKFSHSKQNFEYFKLLSHYDSRDEKNMKEYLKSFKSNDDNICISFIQTSLSKDKKHRELSYMIENITDGNLKINDLKDTRNFTSTDEIIKKIKLIQNCILYFGSKCSWKNIASLYGKSCITVLSK